MHHFPLAPFLESIEDDIPVGVRDYRRIAILLEGGGPWTLERLKDVLLALLVKNQDQRNKFLRRFDAFFPPEARTVSIDEQDRRRVIENIRRLIQSESRELSEPIPLPRGQSIGLGLGPGHSDSGAHSKTKGAKWWVAISLLSICVVIGFGIIHFSDRLPIDPEIQPLSPSSPSLTLEPDTIDFGRIDFDPSQPRQSITRTLTLENPGPGPITLQAVEISGDWEYFQLPATLQPGAFPRQLAEGERQALTLTYNPTTPGHHTAFLDIRSQAGDNPHAVLQGHAKQPVTQPAKRRYRDMPYVDKVEYFPLPEPARGWISDAALALLCLLLAIGYSIHLHRSRKIPEDEPAGFDEDAPRHFPLSRIGGERASMLTDDLLGHLADSMGYFRSEQADRSIDVSASVAATVNNFGIPQIIFSRRKQTRALLVLEDRFSESAAWNTVVPELVRGMEQRGVPVIHGRFECSPDPFRTRDGLVHLEDLEDQRQGFLVLIFTEAQDTPTTGMRSGFALERLARWPMKAWMEYNRADYPSAGSDAGRQGASGSPVSGLASIPRFPATPAGIERAIRGFLTEQGIGEANPSRAASDLAPARLVRPDVHLEHLLGDALPWAQDCAMFQPAIPIGLADALRRAFHPHLPPERLARLFALPDTLDTSAGLRLSRDVSAMLRGGFNTRRKAEDRDAVLRFLQEEIQKAEPAREAGKEPGLAYLKWEMVRERLRLESDPDNDLARLAQLAKSPLGAGLVADLEERPPLAIDKSGGAPANPKARQRLAVLPGNPFNIPKLQVFPISPGKKALLTVLILSFLGFFGKGVADYRETPGLPIGNFEIVGGSSSDEIRLEMNGELTPLSSGRWEFTHLAENPEYRLFLFANGYRAVYPFKTSATQGTRLFIEKKDQSFPCRQDYPAIGLTVLLCTGRETGVADPQQPPIPSDATDDTSPMMTIGLEFTHGENKDAGLESGTSGHMLALLKSGSLDILYRVRPIQGGTPGTPNGKWALEQVFEAMETDLAPWIENSHLVWWQSPDSLPVSSAGLPKFAQTINLSTDDEAVGWAKSRSDVPIIESRTWSQARLQTGPQTASVMGTAQGAFAHPTKLVVRSNVFGDTVTIDGKPVGPTSAAPHTLSPGEHEIRVEKKGFEPFETKITLAAGTKKTIRARLMPVTTVGWAKAPSAVPINQSKTGSQAGSRTGSRTGARTGSQTASVVGSAQGAFAHPTPGQTFRDRLKDGSLGPQMMVIPAGEFRMGSPEDEPARYGDEGPQHRVRIKNAFALGVTAVTFQEYDRFARATRRKLPGDEGWGRGKRPVIYVSWKDATAYAKWLSGQTGQQYRLPTEAEWEYAARAGTTTLFSTGDCITTSRANYDGNYDYADCGAKTGVYRRKTVPAGSLPANPWGLYEMHGNVWEWTADCWHENYGGAPSDGGAWGKENNGDCSRRVRRGGAWYFKPRWLRSALRYRDFTNVAFDDTGFRLARGM